MTDEEIAEEYIKNVRTEWENQTYWVDCTDEVKQAYLDGLAEGRKELENKLKQFEEGEIVCIKHYEAIRDFPVLKEQVEDLKADHEHNLELMKGLNGKIAELKMQIENMKCCGNCKHHYERKIEQGGRCKDHYSDSVCENYESDEMTAGKRLHNERD